jgi:cobalt-precorrin 5A hydrolase/precorrin-3B C17-methyltransferase
MKNKTVIFYITNKGLTLAQRLTDLYPDARVLRFKSEAVPELWKDCRNLIFIMATGIVVRTIAPLITDKKIDPAVVVLDEKGKFVVSLLSGHLGGANDKAREIAHFLKAEAVITTASDVNSKTSIDLWAKENNLVIEDWDLLPQKSTRLLNNGAVRVYQEAEIKLPDDFLKVGDPGFADVIITNKIIPPHPPLLKGGGGDYCGCHVKGQLYLRPKNLVIGIGCNSGTSEDELENAVKNKLKENNLSFLSIHSIATVDKKGDETGLISFARKYNLEIDIFTPDELNSVNGIQKSEAAFKATGAIGVAEPAALLSSGADNLLVPKQKIGNITVAVAEQKTKDRRQKTNPPFTKGGHGGITNSEIQILNSELTRKGRIYIVGTGPGSTEYITPYARNAIRKSDVVVGYDTYLTLIKELIKGKEVISTGMTKEIDRCKKAVELALAGKTVSVISGGDPGIYAMAGLVFEILKDCNALKDKNSSPITDYASRIYIEVIPGISALNACAARLGAPLMHDFAVISLSDRLTPWELIEKRLEAASMSDFIIVLYNPKSRGRQEHINKARDIILKFRDPETPVGIVKAAMRDNEKIVITDLKDMLNHASDMQTTVIIGNSQTFAWNNWMITPRGYGNKFKI